MANLYPGRWARDLLNRLGTTPTEHNITALLAWQYAEGGHTNGARWNPLNTTQPMPGAGNTGTQGNIKVYKDYEQGMDATVKTLRNGRYGGILSALKSGSSAKAVTDAVIASPWGTTALITACLSRGRDTARQHPSLWESKKAPGRKGPDRTPGRQRGSSRTGGAVAGGRGSGRVTLDLEELSGMVRSLDKGAGDADTSVRRVRSAVHQLDQLLIAAGAAPTPKVPGAALPADLLAKVRTTTTPLVDPQGALAAVPRHLRWESDLVRQIRWAATVADGGGSKADQRKVDLLLATLAKGAKIPVGQRVALEMLLGGQLKLAAARSGGGAKKPSTKKPATKKPSTKAPAGTGGVGRKALTIARKEIGVRETSPNYSQRISVYQKTTGAYRQAWCASFVNWALRRAGKTVPGGALAGVTTWVNLARQKQSGLRLVSAADARPGDLVAYDWGGGTDFGADGHIGIVATSPQGGRWTALEGNTSAGKVELKNRSSSMGSVVFIRVA